jgi:hypothetical protein
MSITTLAEAKLHLRVDGTAEDSNIQIYLNAAEKSISNYLGRVLYATSAGTDATGLVSQRCYYKRQWFMKIEIRKKWLKCKAYKCQTSLSGYWTHIA